MGTGGTGCVALGARAVGPDQRAAGALVAPVVAPAPGPVRALPSGGVARQPRARLPIGNPRRAHCAPRAPGRLRVPRPDRADAWLTPKHPPWPRCLAVY